MMMTTPVKRWRRRNSQHVLAPGRRCAGERAPHDSGSVSAISEGLELDRGVGEAVGPDGALSHGQVQTAQDAAPAPKPAAAAAPASSGSRSRLRRRQQLPRGHAVWAAGAGCSRCCAAPQPRRHRRRPQLRRAPVDQCGGRRGAAARRRWRIEMPTPWPAHPRQPVRVAVWAVSGVGSQVQSEVGIRVGSSFEQGCNRQRGRYGCQCANDRTLPPPQSWSAQRGTETAGLAYRARSAGPAWQAAGRIRR